jgi:ribosome-associated protein
MSGGEGPVAVTVRTATIGLVPFLKLAGAAPTGGQAKRMVREGRVSVNGVPETRASHPLRWGDVVTVRGGGAFRPVPPSRHAGEGGTGPRAEA